MPSPASVRPRITPGTRRHVGVAAWAFAGLAGRFAGTAPPNLFLTLGRHRRLFWGWLHFAGALMPGGRLPRREAELVILRVAHRQDCTYEFEHHRRLALRAGVSEAEIRRLTERGAAPGEDLAVGWSAREAAVLAMVDALLDREDLTDDEWNRAAVHLDEREMMELVMLVGHYRMLAASIATLRIGQDAPRR